MWNVLVGVGVLLVVNLIYLNKRKADVNSRAEILVRQAARWAIASEQDNNPIIALLHANYAAGYLWALKDIYTVSEIGLGEDGLMQFERVIVGIQDNATKKVTSACPDTIVGMNDTLMKMAGDKM